ncbi:hypothetical protein SAMN02745221_01028 [Thermosyntropha lipolytica DSM 11003]|uniref:Uncharacterized protein n=1 Tax=Thermosyntropha lipolytica DSM 11003 TaxID=1123382 RepID=A0A1M5MVZ0_9FIRM|nr:hypothetical protein [Thermosyntropha lipolytica]SHG81079.1 hypothetical protein SAMN02745221_01028 [Thermosyntropha lipolytica DSM 11003]
MRSYLNAVLIGAMLGAAAAIYWQDRKAESTTPFVKPERNRRRVLNII